MLVSNAATAELARKQRPAISLAADTTRILDKETESNKKVIILNSGTPECVHPESCLIRTLCPNAIELHP